MEVHRHREQGALGIILLWLYTEADFSSKPIRAVKTSFYTHKWSFHAILSVNAGIFSPHCSYPFGGQLVKVFYILYSVGLKSYNIIYPCNTLKVYVVIYIPHFLENYVEAVAYGFTHSMIFYILWPSTFYDLLHCMIHNKLI